jgi:endonuclease/exonuclease/phosphatase family metal-dependent hydrolase
MGDMNCPTSTVSEEFERLGLQLKQAEHQEPTFPRWKPKHSYDQIWVSESLNIIKGEVLNLGVSDHLPIALEIEVPAKQQIFTIPKQYIN